MYPVTGLAGLIQSAKRFTEKCCGSKPVFLSPMTLHASRGFAANSGNKSTAAIQKPGSIRSKQLRSGTRCRRTQIRHKIGNREIDLMPDGTDHRDCGGCDGPRHDLFVKFPEIFQTPPSPCDHDHINRADGI